MKANAADAAKANPADGEAALAGCLALAAKCPSAAESARALGVASRSAGTLALLAQSLAGSEAIATESGLALAMLARLGGKGADAKIGEAARASLFRALARPESSVRRAAASALVRVSGPAKDAKLEASEASAFLAALQDPDGDTRANVARAAGKQGLAAEVLAAFLKDADWRVRVEVARAFATAPGAAERIDPAIREAAAQLANEKQPTGARYAHPLVTLFETAAKLKRSKDSLPAPQSLSAPTPAATVAVRCAAAEARDRAAADLLETPSCGRGLEPDWRARFRVANLAGDLAGDARDKAPGRALIAAMVDTDPRVRSAAAGSASPAFAAELIERLDDPDAYVVGSAAGSLAKDPAIARASLPAALRAVQRFSNARGEPTGSPRADALASLVALFTAAIAPAPPPGPPPSGASNATAGSATLASFDGGSLSSADSSSGAPQNPSALPPEFALAGPIFSLDASPAVASISLFHALVDLQALLSPAIPTSSYHPPAPELPHAAEAGLPGRGPRPQTLVLTTTVGELRVHLLTDDDAAPLTSAALAALANRGFYDGTLWHRVVPDFVAQGGDPLGDGEGGPGWALPDEHTPLHFRRGTLGIATSGPGTGGSQIFLCHSAQPHLDGRYTIAGQLEGGDAAFVILDALQVGDLILSARAESPTLDSAAQPARLR